MRLIDADALKDIFSGQPPEYYTTAYLTGLIDRMPTVAMGTDHITINWTPELDKLARDVAFRGLNEFSFMGKSIREWVEIILEQPHWVPVEHRLPEREERYLCYLGDHPLGGFCCIVNFNPDAKAFWSYERNVPVSFITHWMPLPEPPVKMEDE